MQRRFFVSGATAAVAVATLIRPAVAQQSETATRVKLVGGRTVSARRPYSYKKVEDFTGSAPTTQLERFELRGGDCSSPGDCSARPLSGRMVTRTRTERVFSTRLKDGDEGLFRYSIFLPSSEYTIVDSVSTTMGQLLAAFKRGGEYDSFPFFSVDTALDSPNSKLTAQLAEARDTEQGSQRQLPIDFGSLRSKDYRDKWINFSVRFGLSSGSDGYITPSVNGRRLGTFEGRTIQSYGYLEIRYGLYQTGTNHFPGGASKIPTQVAYFSGVELLKTN